MDKRAQGIQTDKRKAEVRHLTMVILDYESGIGA